jgi:hypothetical protein
VAKVEQFFKLQKHFRKIMMKFFLKKT